MYSHKKLMRLLRQAYPSLDVRLSRAKTLPAAHGLCFCTGKNKFLIRVDRSIRGQALIDVILHEFAHCPESSWGEWLRTKEHGPLWGEHYARCYKIWEDHFTT